MEVKQRFSTRPVIVPFVLTCVVILLNLGLRDFDWRFNFTNASMSLAFSGIITGTLFGGVCAWWAINLVSHLYTSIQLSKRRISIVFTETFYLWLPVFICYCLAGIAMLLICAFTYDFEFRPADLLPFLSAMVLIYSLGVIGFVVGSKFQQFWVPFALTITLFVACLIAYSTSLAPLTQVGGATAPLVDVVPHWRFHLLGVFGWTVISIAVAHGFLPKRNKPYTLRNIGSAVLALAGLTTVILVDSQHNGDAVDFRLVEVPVEQTCHPLEIGGELCLWSGYESFRDNLEEDLSATIEKFQKLGYSPTVSWGQSEKENDVFISPVASDMKDHAYWGLVDYYVPESCEAVPYGSYETLADYEFEKNPSADLLNRSRGALNLISQCAEQ